MGTPARRVSAIYRQQVASLAALRRPAHSSYRTCIRVKRCIALLLALSSNKRVGTEARRAAQRLPKYTFVYPS